MTTLYIVGGVVIVLIVVSAFGIWFARRKGFEEGQTSVLNEVNKKAAQDAQKTGEIVAEHRDDSDTVNRLRNGNF